MKWRSRPTDYSLALERHHTYSGLSKKKKGYSKRQPVHSCLFFLILLIFLNVLLQGHLSLHSPKHHSGVSFASSHFLRQQSHLDVLHHHSYYTLSKEDSSSNIISPISDTSISSKNTPSTISGLLNEHQRLNNYGDTNRMHYDKNKKLNSVINDLPSIILTKISDESYELSLSHRPLNDVAVIIHNQIGCSIEVTPTGIVFTPNNFNKGKLIEILFANEQNKLNKTKCIEDGKILHELFSTDKLYDRLHVRTNLKDLLLFKNSNENNLDVELKEDDIDETVNGFINTYDEDNDGKGFEADNIIKKIEKILPKYKKEINPTIATISNAYTESTTSTAIDLSEVKSEEEEDDVNDDNLFLLNDEVSLLDDDNIEKADVDHQEMNFKTSLSVDIVNHFDENEDEISFSEKPQIKPIELTSKNEYKSKSYIHIKELIWDNLIKNNSILNADISHIIKNYTCEKTNLPNKAYRCELYKNSLYKTHFFLVNSPLLENDLETAAPLAVIVSGVHGREIAGFRAAGIIAKIWAPKIGRLLVIDKLNRLGIELHTRYLPQISSFNSSSNEVNINNITGSEKDTKQDLNRVFSDDPSKPPVTGLAKEIWRLIKAVRPVLFLDLHEGWGFHGNNNINNKITKKKPLSNKDLISNPSFSKGSSIIASANAIIPAKIMTNAVNKHIKEKNRKFNVLTPPINGGLVRRVYKAFGGFAFVLETTQLNQVLEKRVSQHLLMVGTILKTLGFFSKSFKLDIPKDELKAIHRAGKAEINRAAKILHDKKQNDINKHNVKKHQKKI